MNNEDIHLQDYENARTSLISTVPELERSEFNDECFQSQEDDGTSLDHQTTEKEDAPTTEYAVTAEEGGQLAIVDEWTEEINFSHPGQEMDIDSEGMCSSQSATHNRLEGEDNQESSATQLEHQESQQSTEHQEGYQECFKTTEESDKELSKEGYSEEFQENKSGQELSVITNEEVEEGSTTSPLEVATEDHMALSESHYQEPRTAKVLKVRVELVEETETEEGMIFYKSIEEEFDTVSIG